MPFFQNKQGYLVQSKSITAKSSSPNTHLFKQHKKIGVIENGYGRVGIIIFHHLISASFDYSGSCSITETLSLSLCLSPRLTLPPLTWMLPRGTRGMVGSWAATSFAAT